LLGLPEDTADDALIAVDPASRAVVDLADRVAGTDVTVMLTGESGTGKEVFARYIHRRSRRCNGPFVAINCAAIPEQMLEATLFGYEKGAFTGAWRTTPGKFEQAAGGTLLLDEVSEMQLGLQAKLLRVLQEREVERLGGQKTLSLDLRVLATSNRDMSKEVADGRFREDLYYRLNVFNLRLPPLRERRGDIALLARRLIMRAWNEAGLPVPELTEAARQVLLAHDWPGNVRELDNTIQRALVLSGGTDIGPEQLMLDPGTGRVDPQECGPEAHAGQGSDLRSREHQAIIDALTAVCGNRADAARRLSVSPRTLRYKLARMRAAGIAIPGDSRSVEDCS
jgi:two-component system response regulator FlrC